MEKRTVTVVRPGDKRRAIFGAGDEYYFATGKETDGHYFFFEGIVPPGGGPPPHIQTREEGAFYILEGEVVFYANGEKIDQRAEAHLAALDTVMAYYLSRLGNVQKSRFVAHPMCMNEANRTTNFNTIGTEQ